MKRNATAVWQGSGKEGKGHLTTQSGILNETQYSYTSRFEEGTGTNPEELVAAAHAGCFCMKLSFLVDGAGFTATELNAKCEVTLEDGAINTSHITLKAKIEGIDKAKFDELVTEAKDNCPISKSLTAKTSVEATLN